MHLTNSETVLSVFEQIVIAPLNHPEIVPQVAPLAIGAVVLELYFGKHTSEELGWNTSVGNAVLWISTGVTLLLSSGMTPRERIATYSLIGVGGLVAYMNFYHRWSENIAFRISSSGIVYTLAYLLVVAVKTDLPLNSTGLKASGLFMAAALTVFAVMRDFEYSKPETSLNGVGQV